MKTTTSTIYSVMPDARHYESLDDAKEYVNKQLSDRWDTIERTRDEFGERCSISDDIYTWEFINFETLTVIKIKKTLLYKA